MRKQTLVTSILLALLCPACAAEERRQIYWSDGDSGRFQGKKFRLHGVDAPETGGVGSYGGAKCEYERELGYAAKEDVVEFTRGKLVQVYRDYGEDRYGRLVVDLSVNGQDLAMQMINRGVLKRWDYDGGEPKPNWCGR